MSEFRLKLEAALDLSRQLLSMAESGAWSDLDEAERQRAGLLEQLFQIDARDTEDQRLLVEAVEAILALNAEIVALAEKERDRSAADLRKLRLGQQGKNAYLSVREESTRNN